MDSIEAHLRGEEQRRGVPATTPFVFLTGTTGAFGVAGGCGRKMGSFLRIGLGSFCEFGRLGFFRLWRTGRPFCLEFPELRGAAMENPVRLSTGAVNGELDFFHGFADGFHRVANDVVTGEQRAELCFDAGATAEAPGGAVDFVDQKFFENVRGSEAVLEVFRDCVYD
jgi:hypothetical protein